MSRAFDVVKDLGRVNRGLRDALGAVGGAKSPELIGAAVVLRKSVTRTLSTSGGGAAAQRIGSRRLHAVGGVPSAPGSPPHAQTKRLARSVAQGPAGTGRRVAVLGFYGLFQEEGVDTSLPTRSGRRRKGRRARHRLVLPKRPFMQRALDAVQSEMTDVVVARAAGRDYAVS